MEESRQKNLLAPPNSLNSSEPVSGQDLISFELPKSFFFIPKGFPKLGFFSHNFASIRGFCSGGHLLIVLLCFSSKGLPSSSTFTLEEGTIYLTSESNALEMQDDNASVLDVYLVSNFPFFPFPSG